MRVVAQIFGTITLCLAPSMGLASEAFAEDLLSNGYNVVSLAGAATGSEAEGVNSEWFLVLSKNDEVWSCPVEAPLFPFGTDSVEREWSQYSDTPCVPFAVNTIEISVGDN
jgi:hypothetical protein